MTLFPHGLLLLVSAIPTTNSNEVVTLRYYAAGALVSMVVASTATQAALSNNYVDYNCNNFNSVVEISV